MAYKVIRLDVMSGNSDNTQVKSAKFYAEGEPAAVENGTIVGIKKLIENEREIHEVNAVAETDVLVGIVSTPEVDYDEKKQIEDFINEADVPCRVHVLHEGDFFSIADGEETAEDIACGAKLVAEYQNDEVVGRYTYHCYEVKAKSMVESDETESGADN